MPAFVDALSLSALVAATLEYAIVMRHREERRDAIRWQEEMRESLLSVRSLAPRHQFVDGRTKALAAGWCPSQEIDRQEQTAGHAL